MNLFDELAKQTEREWAKRDNDLASFPDVATNLLKSLTFDWSLEQLNSELQNWLLARQELPKQINVHNVFGQPSVTIFNNERFLVDLYFWVDFDTSIHSHGFRGAFRVLHGESLQETFHTTTLQQLSEDIRIVDMKNVEIEHLKAQAVRAIAPGLELTHRVIHLANPTVTLCLRTINEPELKQWTYLPNGLAIQKNHPSADLVKKIYFYQYLMGRPDLEAARQYLSALLSKLSISAQIHLYEDVASGSLDLREEVVDKIAETIVETHKDSKWWPLYEAAHLARMDEIRFEEMQKPRERLQAHFTNCGYDLAKITDFFGAV